MDGGLWDNEMGVGIFNPECALKCIIDSANLFEQALNDAYNVHKDIAQYEAVSRLAQFTNGTYAVIQRASSRKKAAKAMALYREAIRHRNANWAIKHEL